MFGIGPLELLITIVVVGVPVIMIFRGYSSIIGLLNSIIGLLKSVQGGPATLKCPHCGQETAAATGRCAACGKEL
jgi:hypothetical protein